MEYGVEILEQIEMMAAALLPPSEIAILLSLSAEERKVFCEMCKSHASSEVYLAYHRGKLTTKLELRKTVVKLAKAGSPAAEPLADRYMIEQSKLE